MISKPNRGPLWGWIFVAGVAVMIAGGETAPRRQTVEMKTLLADSGFLLQYADTPEKLDSLKSLEQLKLVRHERNGRIRYTYADAEGCKCMYIGNEETYKQFQKLVHERLSVAGRSADIRSSEGDDTQLRWKLEEDWTDPWGD